MLLKTFIFLGRSFFTFFFFMIHLVASGPAAVIDFEPCAVWAKDVSIETVKSVHQDLAAKVDIEYEGKLRDLQDKPKEQEKVSKKNFAVAKLVYYSKDEKAINGDEKAISPEVCAKLKLQKAKGESSVFQSGNRLKVENGEVYEALDDHTDYEHLYEKKVYVVPETSVQRANKSGESKEPENSAEFILQGKPRTVRGFKRVYQFASDKLRGSIKEKLNCKKYLKELALVEKEYEDQLVRENSFKKVQGQTLHSYTDSEKGIFAFFRQYFSSLKSSSIPQAAKHAIIHLHTLRDMCISCHLNFYLELKQWRSALLKLGAPFNLIGIVSSTKAHGVTATGEKSFVDNAAIFTQYNYEPLFPYPPEQMTAPPGEKEGRKGVGMRVSKDRLGFRSFFNRTVKTKEVSYAGM